jgi:hypothetical protein
MLVEFNIGLAPVKSKRSEHSRKESAEWMPPGNNERRGRLSTVDLGLTGLV